MSGQNGCPSSGFVSGTTQVSPVGVRGHSADTKKVVGPATAQQILGHAFGTPGPEYQCPQRRRFDGFAVYGRMSDQ